MIGGVTAVVSFNSEEFALDPQFHILGTKRLILQETMILWLYSLIFYFSRLHIGRICRARCSL